MWIVYLLDYILYIVKLKNRDNYARHSVYYFGLHKSRDVVKAQRDGAIWIQYTKETTCLVLISSCLLKFVWVLIWLVSWIFRHVSKDLYRFCTRLLHFRIPFLCIFTSKTWLLSAMYITSWFDVKINFYGKNCLYNFIKEYFCSWWKVWLYNVNDLHKKHQISFQKCFL